MNTLKYMFSTTQATWPIRPKISIAVQNFPPSFVCTKMHLAFQPIIFCGRRTVKKHP